MSLCNRRGAGARTKMGAYHGQQRASATDRTAHTKVRRVDAPVRSTLTRRIGFRLLAHGACIAHYWGCLCAEQFAEWTQDRRGAGWFLAGVRRADVSVNGQSSWQPGTATVLRSRRIDTCGIYKMAGRRPIGAVVAARSSNASGKRQPE